MYVIIMGGGRVGLTLAQVLIKDGHDVTLIENKEELCSEAALELDAVVICGSGTDKKILEEARIRDAEVFVAATGNDEANLLSSILVNDYNVPKVIARVSNPDHEEAFKKIGVDNVISPEIAAAAHLERLINRPRIADLIVVGKGNAEIIELTVKNKKVTNTPIKNLSPTESYIIIGINRTGSKDLEIPQPDAKLNYGDKISVLTKQNKSKDLYKKFQN